MEKGKLGGGNRWVTGEGWKKKEGEGCYLEFIQVILNLLKRKDLYLEI